VPPRRERKEDILSPEHLAPQSHHGRSCMRGCSRRRAPCVEWRHRVSTRRFRTEMRVAPRFGGGGWESHRGSPAIGYQPGCRLEPHETFGLDERECPGLTGCGSGTLLIKSLLVNSS
jgi:hypothetical protein